MTGTAREAPRVQSRGSQSQMKADMPPKSAAQPTVTSKHFLLARANHAGGRDCQGTWRKVWIGEEKSWK